MDTELYSGFKQAAMLYIPEWTQKFERCEASCQGTPACDSKVHGVEQNDGGGPRQCPRGNLQPRPQHMEEYAQGVNRVQSAQHLQHDKTSSHFMVLFFGSSLSGLTLSSAASHPG